MQWRITHGRQGASALALPQRRISRGRQGASALALRLCYTGAMSVDSYSTPVSFTARLRGAAVTVLSKPGLAGGPGVDPAATLAAELITPAPGERVLLMGCGNGALGVALARQLHGGHLTLSDPSLIAVRMARLTMAANDHPEVMVSEAVSLLPTGTTAFDRVVILAPQSRALARRWLAEGHALLRPGGTLNLAGANKGGIQPLIGDATALFGNGKTLGYGGGCRVGEALRTAQAPPPPPWATQPGIAPGTWHTLQASLAHAPVDLVSLPGVFSYDRLDQGTALLLQQLTTCAGLRVLDIGCGYGPLGLAAALRGARQSDMLDVSLPAIAAARENIARLNLSQASAEVSDALEAAAGRSYDLIISNPPFHAGKSVDTTMATAFIAQARALLARGGRLLLVANQFLPYERQIATHFDKITRVATDGSYKVLELRAEE
jgi:16S rRNA (guanine1207-N2)-methyltransferase